MVKAGVLGSPENKSDSDDALFPKRSPFTTAPIEEGIQGVQMMGLVIFSGEGTPITASPPHYQPTKGKVSPDLEVGSPQEGVRKEFVTEAWNKVPSNPAVSSQGRLGFKNMGNFRENSLLSVGAKGM
ncbi:hypothetical protein PAXINDRAFT_181960 [Paxillus involutus ATCC 200175]|uniref:Uncharacterized protein n=1 Tax=Paxillus involutus ATCC 200175 TaxID=664439 RepID=A0A0C9T5A5_PAXIN|nr:hypothetical protein PAXINDRAFT_181960 [Paxillus involutus ATCC 200175]